MANHGYKATLLLEVRVALKKICVGSRDPHCQMVNDRLAVSWARKIHDIQHSRVENTSSSFEQLWSDVEDGLRINRQLRAPVERNKLDQALAISQVWIHELVRRQLLLDTLSHDGSCAIDVVFRCQDHALPNPMADENKMRNKTTSAEAGRGLVKLVEATMNGLFGARKAHQRRPRANPNVVFGIPVHVVLFSDKLRVQRHSALAGRGWCVLARRAGFRCTRWLVPHKGLVQLLDFDCKLHLTRTARGVEPGAAENCQRLIDMAGRAHFELRDVDIEHVSTHSDGLACLKAVFELQLLRVVLAEGHPVLAEIRIPEEPAHLRHLKGQHRWWYIWAQRRRVLAWLGRSPMCLVCTTIADSLLGEELAKPLHAVCAREKLLRAPD
eukprot:m.165263 g.165263  ORF g.165263 m.165263 type:complete len:383 (-) comp10326_c2_seq1:768-1916(-)